MTFQTHKQCGQHFKLLYQKAAYWEEMKCLMISDLHLGKSHHFRRGGVGIPKTGDHLNLRSLKGLIGMLNPEVILLLGDLFHSHANDHFYEVAAFIEPYTYLDWHLVMGNHDVMDASFYDQLNLAVHDEYFLCGPFIFTHEPVTSKSVDNSMYNISGHIHPGVKLKGKGRQTLTVPCFYFGRHHAVMPAFGNFTGLHPIKPGSADKVYAIAGKSVMNLEMNQ